MLDYLRFLFPSRYPLKTNVYSQKLISGISLLLCRKVKDYL